jgi:CDP-glycerol glycerophosphotransferase
VFKKLKRTYRRIKKIIIDSILTYKYYQLKINDKLILIESKHGFDLAGNMFYILKELRGKKYDEYRLILVLKKDIQDKVKKILKRYGINNVLFIKPLSLKYCNFLYSSKYLFNDTSFPSWFIKKEGQIYLNTWHGTPLKKMGRDVGNMAYSLGNIQKNFLMADYLLYPNDFMKNKMIDAYMLEDIYKGNIINAGYPRNAIFYDEKRANLLKEELERI